MAYPGMQSTATAARKSMQTRPAVDADLTQPLTGGCSPRLVAQTALTGPAGRVSTLAGKRPQGEFLQRIEGLLQLG